MMIIPGQIMMPFVLLVVSLLQTINGVKPIDDGSKLYAKAFVKQVGDTPVVATKPDPFMAGYFSFRAKVMASLMHTKYTAAHLGLCGTLLGIYDPDAGKAIKAPAERIMKGDKDFDSLTPQEVEVISKALAKFNPYSEKLPGIADEGARQFLAGARLGMLSSRVTVWHISPRQKILLGDMAESVKACAEAGDKGQGLSLDLATALKGFAAFKDKELDEATVLKLGKQIEVALRASLPEKYRWPD